MIHFKKLNKIASSGEESALFDLVYYCRQALDLVGSGSSRDVFQLSNHRVLKVAINAFGLSQNKVELDNAVSCDVMVPKVFETGFVMGPGVSWIVTEYVFPIDKNEFEQIASVSFDSFCKEINRLNAESVIFYYGMENAPKRSDGKCPCFEVEDFTQRVSMFIRHNGLLVGDVLSLHHWGTTVDKRLVLLDSGHSWESGNHFVDL